MFSWNGNSALLGPVFKDAILKLYIFSTIWLNTKSSHIGILWLVKSQNYMWTNNYTLNASSMIYLMVYSEIQYCHKPQQSMEAWSKRMT